MHFNLYITFNKNKYLHSNFKDLGSQSYIEPGDASVPSGTAVPQHHLSVGTHVCQHMWLFKKCLDISCNFLWHNLWSWFQNNPEVKSSSMTREKNDKVQDQNSTIGRNAPKYKQVNHETTWIHTMSPLCSITFVTLKVLTIFSTFNSNGNGLCSSMATSHKSPSTQTKSATHVQL